MRKKKQSTLPTKYEPGFFAKLDGRTEIARELRATYDDITSDLGGADSLSTVKRTLVEKFCWLSQVMRGVERQIVQSDDSQAADLLAKWVQSLNSLVGLARLLSIERKTRKVDLKSYVEGKR